jgi:hypothetical protein
VQPPSGIEQPHRVPAILMALHNGEVTSRFFAAASNRSHWLIGLPSSTNVFSGLVIGLPSIQTVHAAAPSAELTGWNWSRTIMEARINFLCETDMLALVVVTITAGKLSLD